MLEDFLEGFIIEVSPIIDLELFVEWLNLAPSDEDARDLWMSIKLLFENESKRN